MSKRSTEGLLLKLMSELEGSRARKQLSASKHMVNIRERDLAEAYKDAYNRVRAKDPTLPDPTGWKIFNSAAKGAIAQLRVHLAKNTVRAYESSNSRKINSPSYITYVSPRGYGPTKLLKAVGVTYIDRKLKEYNTGLSTVTGPNRETSQAGLFKTAIEFHHKGTTVGAAQLAQALTFLDSTTYWQDFSQSGEIDSLRDLFGDFDLRFEVSPSDFSVKIREEYIITGEVGSHRKNFAGSELNDWKDIKPELEKSLRGWAKKQDWWNRKGSPSIGDDSKKAVEHVVVSILSQVKGAKVLKKTKAVKRKPSTTHKRFAGTTPKMSGGGKKASAPTHNAQRGVASSPLYLIGILNKQLPDTVARNMGPPGLEYRTGRLANSAKVTDITQTPKGFPSIGYTYQKSPYDTFEPGGAQGSVARDPRKLIDKSIREIAAQHAIGRFYTRSV